MSVNSESGAEVFENLFGTNYKLIAKSSSIAFKGWEVRKVLEITCFRKFLFLYRREFVGFE